MATRTRYEVATEIRGSLSLGLVALDKAVPAEDSARSWIQLATCGAFYSPKYGAFSITPDDLNQIIINFSQITPKAPTRLPIDYNHGTAKENQTPESAKAAGWVETLELRNSGRELWALVEWTDQAASMIAAKEYQFISPVLSFHYTHSSGRDIGTTLLSAALTNTPFLEGMAPVTLARDFAVSTEGVPVEEPMPEALILAKFSFTEMGRRVNEAIEKTVPMCPHCNATKFSGSWMPPGSEMPALSATDIYDSAAMCRCAKCGSHAKLAYEIDADTGAVTLTGSPVEVVPSYDEVGVMASTVAASKQEAGANMATKKIKTAAGAEVEVEESVLVALAKEMAPAAVPVELAKQVETLNTNIVALTAQNAALRTEVDEFKNRERDAAINAVIDAGIKAGKFVPAQKDSLVTLAKVNLDAVKAMIDVAPVKVELAKEHGTGGNAGAVTAHAQVVALAKDKVNEKTDLAAAMEQVFAENPDLYEAYRAEVAVKV